MRDEADEPWITFKFTIQSDLNYSRNGRYGPPGLCFEIVGHAANVATRLNGKLGDALWRGYYRNSGIPLKDVQAVACT